MKNLYSPTTTSTAVVEADPANPQNKVLHVKNTEWNTFVEYALPDGVTVTFGITDTAAVIPTEYKGILPDLFKEGKGVVAQGKLDERGVFVASEVLAKHDENYMPPEAQEAVDKAHAAMKTFDEKGSKEAAAQAAKK